MTAGDVPKLYRRNVGLMLIAPDRRIFVGRRANQSNAWQMPQGGVDDGETPVEAVLGPISLSALTLLQQADLTRVKQCQGEKCGWLFFDATKNKSRRWCEMEVCGNRAKQKRFSERCLDGRISRRESQRVANFADRIRI